MGAILKHRTGHTTVFLATIMATILFSGHGSMCSPDKLPAGRQLPETDAVKIERIGPQRPGGQGYQLVYRVNVPIAVYWKFKTDFDNAFLIENKFIRDHRFISQAGNTAITENKYSYGPDVFFRWQTELSPAVHRLDFLLLNPEQCQQRYHYGFIQLAAEGQSTRVTQVAFFDFWGASFWAHYPWQGGMRDFLDYTARWEQATALRLKDRYGGANDNPE
ncbi:hypothetical protein DSCA_10770 [Desulfosarcina alkanivorans]|jgi:hypothetical protein|uniref:Uncharacterized protein n=1 Tax=Desulfosarcina alkanivorans TaxID=571177 RepID=A0A5K7YR85_9BACT|nr:hypothetical protein [Desulfosarcina alkanivorans]BBO67147.1 hypothetical protein DSCA_10770 [Desulfosarcina alkanivorans]